MLNKKGFLFTVTIFFILMYILLSISVWVKSIESSERSFSEFYKESTVELTLEQITPGKLDGLTYMIMNRNLMRLNGQAEEFAVKSGPPEDENLYIRSAMLDLLVNGSAPSDYFEGTVPLPTENTSLKVWVADLNASLRAIGVYVSRFDVSAFQMVQGDMDMVNYSFNITLELRDFTNTSSVSRVYQISDALNISGLVDPALVRESRDNAGDAAIVYRQFFFNKADYPDAGAISVSKLAQDVNAGQGWLYAPLAKASGSADLVPEWSEIPPLSGNRKGYILVGTFDEIESLGPGVYGEFAGYIVTTTPSITSSECGNEESDTFNPISYSGKPQCQIGINSAAGITTAKPFMVAHGFNPAKASECPILDGSNITRRCVLMINRYSESDVGDNPLRKTATAHSGLYDVEMMRGFVMCGLYTHNPNAPSYLQRLLPHPFTRNNTEFGIETFVIGNYANNYSIYDTNSRLDRELFNGSIDGIKVRGLPGCKSYSSCADSPITGIFAVSNDARDDYGLDQIACDNGAAGCD